MKPIVVSDRVKGPVAHVFAVFTDLQELPRRVSSIQDVHELTHGGFRLGTRWHEVRALLGAPDTAEMEVTAFERERSYRVTHHKAGVRLDALFTFEPEGADTRVTIELSLSGPGLPPGVVEPLGWAVGGKARDVLARDLADLKRAAESEVPDAAPPVG